MPEPHFGYKSIEADRGDTMAKNKTAAGARNKKKPAEENWFMVWITSNEDDDHRLTNLLKKVILIGTAAGVVLGGPWWLINQFGSESEVEVEKFEVFELENGCKQFSWVVSGSSTVQVVITDKATGNEQTEAVRPIGSRAVCNGDLSLEALDSDGQAFSPPPPATVNPPTTSPTSSSSSSTSSSTSTTSTTSTTQRTDEQLDRITVDAPALRVRQMGVSRDGRWFVTLEWDRVNDVAVRIEQDGRSVTAEGGDTNGVVTDYFPFEQGKTYRFLANASTELAESTWSGLDVEFDCTGSCFRAPDIRVNRVCFDDSGIPFVSFVWSANQPWGSEVEIERDQQLIARDADTAYRHTEPDLAEADILSYRARNVRPNAESEWAVLDDFVFQPEEDC